MNCTRSFNFLSLGQANFSSPDVKTWLSGTETFWAFDRTGSSTFNIQGFKNIDVYRIDVIGNIGTQVLPLLGGAITTDWSVFISINGITPIISSVISVTNDFNIIDTQGLTNNFQLGRFIPSVEFSSPVKSVLSISIGGLKANGTGAQTSGNLNLQYNLNIVVHYKFEGEQFAFL